MKRHIWNSIMGFFCIGVSLYALSYYLFEHGFLAGKGEIADSRIWNFAFHLHFTGGAVALGIGWTQFLKRFRTKSIGLHRTLGKIYIVSILLVSSPAALYMATLSNGGFNNVVGFGMMAIVWFGFTTAAYKSIKSGDVEQHEKWMIRSFAVTLGAVSLRLFLPLMLIGGVSAEEAYQTIAWGCWVPNLFIAEWLIMRANRKKAVA